MLSINQSLEDLVLNGQDPDLDFFRFCLSDQISPSIEAVLQGDITPLFFAKKSMETSYDVLYNRFFKDRLCKSNIPSIFIEGWIFDRLMMSATLMRAAVVRPFGMEGISELISTVNPFLLLINKEGSHKTQFAGVADFFLTAEIFISQTKDRFTSSHINHLETMISYISHIENRNWLFYDKKWQKVCIDHPVRTQILRGFFHTSLVANLVPDDHLSYIFNLERKDLLSFIDDFINLRQSSRTKVSDIKEFIQDLTYYFKEMKTNVFYYFLYNEHFHKFKIFHDSNFGDQYNKPEDVQVIVK